MKQQVILRATLMCALLGTLAACGSSADSTTASGNSSNSIIPSSNSNNTPAGATAAGIVSLSAQNYTVPVAAATALITVYRSGGSSGQATVAYTTVDGTATAGSDFASTNGTVTWADGDATPKTIAVTIHPRGGNRSFGVALTAISGGADLGAPMTATVSVDSSLTGMGSTASSNGTAVGGGGQIIDSALNHWSIVNGVVYEGNSPAGYSANVVALMYYGGKVYQENSACLWWSWDGSSWVASSNPNPSLAPRCGSGGSASGGAGTVSFSAGSYSVAPSAGQIVVTVDRTGGASGAASVAYTTMAGSAQPGADYTPASGTLSWAAGDSSAKTFTVKLTSTGAGGKSLTASLSNASGASLGSSTATLSIASAATGGTLSIHASGSQLIDGNGNPVQLRGANLSTLESLFLNPTSNYWQGANLGSYPFFAPIKGWKMNVVRIPLNEATWLRYQGSDIMNTGGGTQTPDASGNYRAAVERAVKDANAAGLYVILDLHWTAPGSYLANTQDQLPDTDHTVAFWTSLAQIFGNNPAVIFDLFNEPYPEPAGSQNVYDVLLNGAPQSVISFNSGNSKISHNWTSVGMQELVNTVRNAGAINLLMVGGASGATDLSGFTKAGGGYFPDDPLKNIAASWHAYGVNSSGFTMHNATWSGSINPTAVANTLLSQGIPVIIGEVGDASRNGTVGSPVISYVTNWADAHGQSVVCWTWDVWSSTGGNANLLIKDASGTPTDGEGITFKNWLAQH